MYKTSNSLKKIYRHYLYLMILWVQFELYFQNLQYCRDLLMGNPQWQQLDHMPSPGLFQERKATNFFQVHHCINQSVLSYVHVGLLST